MKRLRSCAVAFCASMLAVSAAQAAYLLQVDLDGVTDAGTLSLNPKVSFGGDMVEPNGGVGVSVHSTAVGLAPGNSIFGGNGVMQADTYIYTYSPGADGDNLALAAGTALNNDGHVATGLTAGSSGKYNVYVTWPSTANTAGDVNYTLRDSLDATVLTLMVNQNTTQGELTGVPPTFTAGGEWIFLGAATLSSTETYRLFQEATANTFVSMRAEGVLFDKVPEPASLALAGLASLAGVAIRRRLS